MPGKTAESRRRAGAKVRPRTPDSPPLPPQAVDDRTPEQRTEDEQLGFVRRLRERGLSQNMIVQACRAQYSIGRDRTERLLRMVLEGLRTEMEMNRPYTKGEQIARLRGYISTLNGQLDTERRRTRPNPASTAALPLPPVDDTDSKAITELTRSLVAAERMLAEVEGNRAPTEIQITGNLSAAAQVVFASLTPERTQFLLDRARERKRLAEAIDVPGTRVPG